MELIYFSNKYSNFKHFVDDKTTTVSNYLGDSHNVETLGVTLATLGIVCYYILLKIQERNKG
jgi:hypothetical protein